MLWLRRVPKASAQVQDDGTGGERMRTVIPVDENKTEYSGAAESLKAYEEDRLSRLTNFHAGFHGVR